MEFQIGANQYGKAEVRLLSVDRSAPAHRFVDLNVSVALSGDLDDVHLSGSNAHVVATDTQQNTVYAFARTLPFSELAEIETFGLALARHFTDTYEPISRARVRIESAGWERIPVGGAPHEHSFVRAGGELRVCEVVVDRGSVPGEWALSGLRDLIVLKTTGSAFFGFIRDSFTTLAETDDRILSTSVNARWRHGALRAAGEWDASFRAARAAALERFSVLDSLSLQQTLHQMGVAVMEASPGIVEVRLSMPNRHHFPVNLEPLGLDNPNVVFRVQDRPYGLIEGQVLAAGAAQPGPVWDPSPML
jgi:urate oxidase